jgi:Peptidase family M23
MNRSLRTLAAIALGAAASLSVGAPNAQAQIPISSAADLQNIVNNLSGRYILQSDVDLSSIPNWIPIGDATNPFTGSLDGLSCTTPSDPQSCKAYKISSLTITSSTGPVGLFGVVSQGSIRNVELQNVNVRVSVGTDGTYPAIGAIAGVIGSGSVYGVSASGRITVGVSSPTAGSSTGGLVGNLGGTLEHSSSSVDVFVSGGIIGGGIGGLVGSACCSKSSANSISDSYATGSVTTRSVVGGNVAGGVGGLVGSNGAIIQRSYSTGTVDSDTATNTGGLVGVAAWDLGSVNQSFATGSVKGGPDSKVGGLVGWVYDVWVSQSYATGEVSGGERAVAGGLAGQNGGGCWPCSAGISEAYSTGRVSAGTDGAVGGFLGFNASDGSVSASYWDLDTSGQAASAGGGGALSLTTAQFTSGTLPNGLDPVVWTAASGMYPTLSWQPPPAPATGTISVTTNLSAASFSITGSATYGGSGTSFVQTNAPAGSYTIMYGSVAGYLSPASQNGILTAGGSLAFSGTYTVPPPQVSVLPNELAFSYQEGASRPLVPQTTTLSSSGSPVTFAVTAVTETGGNWLSVSPNGGATPSTLSLNVALGLAPGTYSGRVDVVASGAANSLLSVLVTLTVTRASDGFKLTRFPLAGVSPDEVEIISVFDHSMFLTPYSKSLSGVTSECYDGTVESYRGEVAIDTETNRSHGVVVTDVCPTPALYGFGRTTAPFEVNQHYVGDANDGGPYMLNYDGHGAYDFRTYGVDGHVVGPAPVFAAADGTIETVGCIVPTKKGQECYGTIAIKHKNGYRTVYLHLSAQKDENGRQWRVNDPVRSGQQIGMSGKTGATGVHLHFEVRRQLDGVWVSVKGVPKLMNKQWVPVDPYGWCGVGVDPYSLTVGGVNVPLWAQGSKCVPVQ